MWLGKQSRAGHEQIGAGRGARADRLEVHAAVDRQQHARAARRPQMAQLLQRHGLELLTAEAGHDAHHQHEVAEIEAAAQGLDRRGRIQRDARRRPQRANLVQQRPRIGHRFDVDRQQVGARLAEPLHVAARLGNHQMHVQRQARSSGGRPRPPAGRSSGWARSGRP